MGPTHHTQRVKPKVVRLISSNRSTVNVLIVYDLECSLYHMRMNENAKIFSAVDTPHETLRRWVQKEKRVADKQAPKKGSTQGQTSGAPLEASLSQEKALAVELSHRSDGKVQKEKRVADKQAPKKGSTQGQTSGAPLEASLSQEKALAVELSHRSDGKVGLGKEQEGGYSGAERQIEGYRAREVEPPASTG
ncbi:hypothetical protein U1Q18_009136 [Sarracenia purpurea var. burkii]